MAADCNLGYVTNCPYPRYERVGEPNKLVVWWVNQGYEELIGDVSTQRPRFINKGGQHAYHYVIDLSRATGIVAADLVAWNFTKPQAGSPDDTSIHVALVEWSKCTPADSKKQIELLAKLFCCLKQEYPDLAVTLPSAIDITYLDEEIHPGHVEKPDVLMMLATLTADCAAVIDGIYAWDEEDLNIVRESPLRVANLHGMGSGLCGSCGCQSSCSCSTPCNSCSAPRCYTTPTPETTCDACTRLDEMQDTVDALGAQFAALITKFDKIIEWQETNEDALATAATLGVANGEQIDNIRVYLASIKACLDCVCVGMTFNNVIEYAIGANDSGKNCFVPNINKILDFATRVSDLNPAAVHTGPRWMANLPGNDYQTELHLELPPIEYCGGCKVWVDLIQCGVRTRIVTETMVAGLQPLTIDWAGTINITSPCPDLHFEVGTDTTLGAPARYCVSSGYVKFTPCTL